MSLALVKSPSQATTLWFTGLSASGKTTLARALHERLASQGVHSYVLDGDVLRAGLCKDLGFSAADRSENIRRVAEVARLMNDAGVVVLCALISPLQVDRDAARQIVGAERFFEIHVATPLLVCEQRDPKGLYRRARANQVEQFTGISAPYEAPQAPALRLDTQEFSVEQAVDQLLTVLAQPALTS